MAKAIQYADTKLRRAETRITLYVLMMVCGKCKKGKMFNCGPRVDGITPHRCNNCGRRASYPGEGYPRTQTQMENL